MGLDMEGVSDLDIVSTALALMAHTPGCNVVFKVLVLADVQN